MVWINFEEVGLRRTKSGKCSVCGKRAQRTFYEYQTLSQYNRNKDGFRKTKEEILQEVGEKLDQLCNVPLVHLKCEDELKREI